jgi:hypothetical protein
MSNARDVGKYADKQIDPKGDTHNNKSTFATAMGSKM